MPVVFLFDVWGWDKKGPLNEQIGRPKRAFKTTRRKEMSFLRAWAKRETSDYLSFLMAQLCFTRSRKMGGNGRAMGNQGLGSTKRTCLLWAQCRGSLTWDWVSNGCSMLVHFVKFPFPLSVGSNQLPARKRDSYTEESWEPEQKTHHGTCVAPFVFKGHVDPIFGSTCGSTCRPIECAELKVAHVSLWEGGSCFSGHTHTLIVWRGERDSHMPLLTIYQWNEKKGGPQRQTLPTEPKSVCQSLVFTCTFAVWMNECSCSPTGFPFESGFHSLSVFFLSFISGASGITIINSFFGLFNAPHSFCPLVDLTKDVTDRQSTHTQTRIHPPNLPTKSHWIWAVKLAEKFVRPSIPSLAL